MENQLTLGCEHTHLLGQQRKNQRDSITDCVSSQAARSGKATESHSERTPAPQTLLCQNKNASPAQLSHEGGGAVMAVCVGNNILLKIPALTPVVPSMQNLGLRQT